jgi:diaminohydroxyphosphoribosylaminopyrimidine deaminase/5-amino-6-(5-phosphoribosylamino)uracil reductase
VGDGTLPHVYSDEFREKTIVVTTRHGGAGYVRKLKERGVQVWVCESATQRVGMEEFSQRCVEAKLPGVLLEGGPRLLSQAIQERALNHLFVYSAPMLLGDDRAKPMLSGFRAESLAHAIRLEEVSHVILGSDILTQGRIAYPTKLQIDEAVFSLG